MKKIYLLFLSMALVLAVSCSHNSKTTKEPESPTTDDPATPTGPTVQELLSKLPISFNEFEAQIKASGNRNASRTAVALTDSETQGFSTSGYSDGSEEDLITQIFLSILKNDIRTLDGFGDNKDFTIPTSFTVSQETLTKLGITEDWLEGITWGSIKNATEVIEGTKEINESIYWKIHMINGDGEDSDAFILIKGIYNTETETYRDLTRYTSYNFGFPMIGAAHFFTSNGKIGVNVVTNEDGRISKSLFIENNTESEFYADGWDYLNKHESYSYTNSTYQINYSADQNVYNMFDNNKQLFVSIKADDNSPVTYTQTIPLHFMNTGNHAITRDEGELKQQTMHQIKYYIDGNQTSNIVSESFEIPSGDDYEHIIYPCYVIKNATAPGAFTIPDEGFSFSKEQLVAPAIQKINSMSSSFKSGALNSYLGTEAELQELDTQCKAWADSLQ